MQKEFRKRAKKKMAEAKAAGDSFMEQTFNAQQLAYKVSYRFANAVIVRCIFKLCLYYMQVVMNR